MAVGYEVRSCSEFLTGRASHPARCASYLLFNLKGQSKVISVIRSGLDIAEYATRGQEPTHARVACANEFFGDVKIILNFVNLPNDAASLGHKCEKTAHTYRSIYTSYVEGRPIGHREWVLAGTRSAGVVKKTLTIVGDGIFKPIQFVDKYADIGTVGTALSETWQVLSIVKSSAKIVNCSGRVYLGSKTTERKVVDIGLELWEMLYAILRCSNVQVHPIAGIVLSVAKSVFGLAEAWIKTA